MTLGILTLLVLIPLVSLVIMLFVPRRREFEISTVALIGVSADFIVYLALLYYWMRGGFVPIAESLGSLHMSTSYSFDFHWFFDGISAVFFGLTCIITILILIFSKFYMHRDPRFSRYFSIILLFYVGLSLVILSGNLDVLFLGWEWIGMSSFLLIAYYRDRFLPVRNALKVFSLYRVSDAVMIVAIWLLHHVFENGIDFAHYPNFVAAHGNEFTIIGFLFLLVAAIKSAQFPFSYWLPRAMEGPTTSSAIFYGALSVHMGLFVLLRTYPLWEGSVELRIAIAILGVITALVASSIARVQSSIKGQIAYASITQIGIMFVELAAGAYWLVLLHMISNAFLRTYQLLISPSIVSYLVHDQFFHFAQPRVDISDTFMGKLRTTVFVLSIKEWDMNSAITQYVWKPLKAVGRTLSFLDVVPAYVISFTLLLVATGVVGAKFLGVTPVPVISSLTMILGILFFIRAYATKQAPKTCWNLLMLGHLFVMLFFSFTTGSTKYSMLLYVSGIFATYVLGHLCLQHLESRGETAFLFDYNGHVYEYPRLAFVFFLVCLGYMAFPVTPTFLGQDILLNTLPIQSVVDVVLFGVAYLLGGISIMRLYVKVFFGPHKKRYHEIAYRSA